MGVEIVSDIGKISISSASYIGQCFSYSQTREQAAELCGRLAICCKINTLPNLGNIAIM